MSKVLSRHSGASLGFYILDHVHCRPVYTKGVFVLWNKSIWEPRRWTSMEIIDGRFIALVRTLGSPSTDMWFLMRGPDKGGPAARASLGFLGPFMSSCQASCSLSSSLWSFSISSPQQRPGSLPCWVIASVDQFVFPKLWSHCGTGQGCSCATHSVSREGCVSPAQRR